MVLETRATFGKQPIRQHFARPFDRQVGGKDPDVGRGPHRTMILGQFRIKEVRPDRHVDSIAALRMEVSNGARADHGIEIAPYRSRFIRQAVESHGILCVEERISSIDGDFQGIRRQRQFSALSNEPFEQRPTFRLFQRIRQSGIGHADELEKKETPYSPPADTDGTR